MSDELAEMLALRAEVASLRRERADVRLWAAAVVQSANHDLRSPLNAILGYSDLIQDELDSAGVPDLKRDVERIGASGRKLLERLDSLMTEVRRELREVELHRQPFEVADLLQASVGDAPVDIATGLPTISLDPGVLFALQRLFAHLRHWCPAGLRVEARPQATGNGDLLLIKIRLPGVQPTTLTDSTKILGGAGPDAKWRDQRRLGLLARQSIIASGGDLIIGRDDDGAAMVVVQLPYVS